MLDFGALVLAPAMTVFARPAMLTPVKSQPGQPAYPCRGIWKAQPVDVQISIGEIDTVGLTLGIKLSDPAFTVPPEVGDELFIPAAGPYPHVGRFQISNIDPDGQGGSILRLKLFDAPFKR